MRSSTAVLTFSKLPVQLLRKDIFLRSSSAFFGSSQKPGCCVIISFSLTRADLPSMSKIPP
jgi:hypothetical protein